VKIIAIVGTKKQSGVIDVRESSILSMKTDTQNDTQNDNIILILEHKTKTKNFC
jgi:hypothetical protein